MPVLGRTTPCRDCPWLRKSTPGWLGDDNPEHFYWAAVTAEVEMPCHAQINYGDEDWDEVQLPGVDLCAGNLIYFRNHMKVPRNPVLATAVTAVLRSAAVFSWPHEFLGHHLRLTRNSEALHSAVHTATCGEEPWT